jgi:hypothetical protein
MKLEAKADESGLSLVSMKAPKGVCETDKDSCVIDMKCSSHKGFYEVSQGEKICRICHLTFGQSSDATSVENGSATSGDFIQLGCSCKDELGIAHIHCAEVWFKLKGNRYMLWLNFSLISIYRLTIRLLTCFLRFCIEAFDIVPIPDAVNLFLKC